MTIAKGERLGPYEVQSPLGEGGMGEVYRAKDTRLDRSVAIKVFKQAFTERFEREAMAIAALNHPNICTLHDVGRQGETPYLVMELINGSPVSGPMPPGEAVGYALQILDALRAAHRVGIVHRDLKPANILRTPGGVKLLDFGLAKRVSKEERDSDLTLTMHQTQEQTIVGTLQYMAPEQLEGKEADARSDIFAFGCLFYEMLSGTRVFQGDTPASVIAAVMSAEPRPIGDVGQTAGLPLETLIRRCLEKRPEDRWQTAQDLHSALKLLSLQAGIQGKSEGAPQGLPKWVWACVPVAALASAAAGWWLASLGAEKGPAAVEVRAHPLASASELMVSPSWSPDGKTIVYAAFRNGSMDVWKRAVDRDAEVQITSSPANETDPAFSPDGRMLALGSDAEGGGVFLAPADGGVPARLTSFGAHPEWSPDGKEIAFDWSGAVYVAAVRGGQPRRLLDGTGGARTYLNWSPDGQRMVLWHRVLSDVVVLERAGGKLSKLGLVPPGEDVSGMSVSRDGTAMVISRGPMGGNKELWRVGLDPATLKPVGTPVRLAMALTDNVDCRLSPDGSRIAFAVRELKRHLWGFPVSAETGLPSGEPVILTQRGERNYYPSASPDGRTLIWTSQSGDYGLLYYRHLDGADEVKLTQDWESGGREVLASFSPDGQQIAYASTAGGAFQIWRMPSLQSVSLRITENEKQFRDTWPVWSRDGQQIAFHSTRTGNFDLWIVSPTGGGLRKVTDWPSNESRPAYSPDGRMLGFVTDKSGSADIWAAELATGKMAPLVEGPAEDGPLCWSPDGRRLYFISNRAGSYDLWMKPASGGAPQLVVASQVNRAIPDDLSFSKFEVTARQVIVPLESKKSRLYMLDGWVR